MYELVAFDENELKRTNKTAYTSHLAADEVQTHVGNMGFPTGPPLNAASYTALKSSPVGDDAMLSDLTKTEK